MAFSIFVVSAGPWATQRAPLNRLEMIDQNGDTVVFDVRRFHAALST